MKKILFGILLMSISSVVYSLSLLETVEQKDLNSVKQWLDIETTIDDPDEWGFTPLMLAVLLEKTDIVSYLVDKGADVNFRNAYGISAYDIGKSNSTDNIYDLLDKKGNLRSYDGKKNTWKDVSTLYIHVENKRNIVIKSLSNVDNKVNNNE